MALKSANPTATTAFESEDETVTTTATETMNTDTSNDAGATTTQSEDTVATTVEVKTSALVAGGQRALSTAKSVMKANVISGLKDAFRVEFDSLPAIGASNGAFQLKADDTEIGKVLRLQLVSYQESWVCSPSDTKADVELVKYSDDGVTSRDGINLLAHLEDLKAQGYSKAKIGHRNMLVGELLHADVENENIGNLVMIDLPDSGRRSFNTYTLQASYAVAKGRKTADDAAILTLTATPDKTKSGEKYTKIVIS